MRNAYELMRRQLQLENIKLNLDMPTSGFLVDGSESQLEQVLLNMIGNARDAILEQTHEKAGNSQHGRIDVKLERHAEDSTLLLKITDTGGGIPGDVLARIFDPFFTTKEVGVGTGLGLSVSYGIINAMGGTITARNTEGGCEMCIELPLSEDELSDGLAANVTATRLQ